MSRRTKRPRIVRVTSRASTGVRTSAVAARVGGAAAVGVVAGVGSRATRVPHAVNSNDTAAMPASLCINRNHRCRCLHVYASRSTLPTVERGGALRAASTIPCRLSHRAAV